MDDSSELWMLTKSYGPMAPIFLTWIIAIIWAIARWRRHSQVSMLCVLGFGTMILVEVVDVGLWIYLNQIPISDIQELERYSLIMRTLVCGVTALGWALILLAIFGWRSNPGGGWGGAFARHEERVTLPDPDRAETR
jgi:hypothetical protein